MSQRNHVRASTESCKGFATCLFFFEFLNVFVKWISDTYDFQNKNPNVSKLFPAVEMLLHSAVEMLLHYCVTTSFAAAFKMLVLQLFGREFQITKSFRTTIDTEDLVKWNLVWYECIELII